MLDGFTNLCSDHKNGVLLASQKHSGLLSSKGMLFVVCMCSCKKSHFKVVSKYYGRLYSSPFIVHHRQLLRELEESYNIYLFTGQFFVIFCYIFGSTTQLLKKVFVENFERSN